LTADASLLRQVQGLRGGGGRWLRTLDLSFLAGLTEPALAALADALLEGACPQLAVLGLSRLWVAEGSADPLWRAVTAGALPLLEELKLWGCRIGAEAARGLMAALRAGVTPELRKAHFGYCGFEDRTAQALRAAIMEGCPGVRKNGLHIYS
jgi:hypothetical protein